MRGCASWVVVLWALGCGAPASQDGGAQPAETQTGDNAQWVFTVTPQQAPRQGTNDFTLKLKAATDDRPVSGAQWHVTWTMPAHGHSGSGDAEVVDQGGGTYRVGGVDFSMPGSWDVVFAASAAPQADQATFHYDVP